MPVQDVLPEIGLTVSAVVVVLVASFVAHRRHGWCALLALLGIAVSVLLTLQDGGRSPSLTFHGTWALDGATQTARLVILAFTAVSVLMAPDWMRSDRRHGEFYAVLLLSALGAILMAGASDFLELVVGVLLSSVTGFALAAYHRDWGVSVEAGMKYFLMGALANALLVAGVVLLFGLTGETSYGPVAESLAGRASGSGPDPGVLVSAAFLAVGLAYKLAAFPAHAWMPDVAEGAPAPSAAFLTVVPKVGGLVALARITGIFSGSLMPWTGLVAALSVATMTLGNLAALWQTDVRRLIGWSSVAQSGYALMAVAALGSGSGFALPALLFFLVGYGAANLTAFAVVAHLRGRTELSDYRGLGGRRPLAAAALGIAFLSLVGIPPLAGFIGKLAVFGAAIDAGYGWLAIVAVANTVASLFYYLRVIVPMYFVDPDGLPPASVLGRWTGVAVAVSLLCTVAVGVAAEALWPLLPSGGLLP